MPMTTTADVHDLLAAERFLAAETRIAGTFCGRVEEAVAPLLPRHAGDGTDHLRDRSRARRDPRPRLPAATLRPERGGEEWFVG